MFENNFRTQEEFSIYLFICLLFILSRQEHKIFFFTIK